MRRFPPGPKSNYPGEVFFKFRRDPIGFLEEAARDFGDLVHWKIGWQDTFLVNNPAWIRNVLITDGEKFFKAVDASISLLGLGLTVSNGSLHQRQRRSMQPAFHHDRIVKFAEVMVARAEGTQAQWQEGATVDIKDEMERISLGVVGDTLFGTNLDRYAATISQAMIAVLGAPPNMILGAGKWIEKLPLPKLRHAKAGRAVLHRIIQQIIAERRASTEQDDDVLALLLAANAQGNGASMSDQQVHDEVINLLIAGYETTSDALTWTWYLLSQHPEAEDQLHEELDRVLGDQLPGLSHFESLRFTQNVVRESLRLYPPLWVIWRRALKDYRFDGYVAPAGSLVLMSQHVTQRDERFFPEPLRFNPDRWSPEFRQRLPKLAYFPFGAGARQCLGDRFGFMEIVLVIATIAQKWKLQLAPGHAVIPDPLFTLRPKSNVPMITRRR